MHLVAARTRILLLLLLLQCSLVLEVALALDHQEMLSLFRRQAL